MELMTDFDTFWEACPRKTDKAKAKKAWEKLTDAEHFNATQGMKHHRDNNPQWKNPKLIPHPTTFLNGKRWQDDIVEDKPATVRIQENEIDSNAMIIWKGLSQIYGKPWADRHGEKPPPVWVSQLAHLEPYQVKRALKKSLETKSDFMVSLPKLLEFAAKTFGEVHPDQKRLESPRSRELGLKAFAECLDILGVKS